MAALPKQTRRPPGEIGESMEARAERFLCRQGLAPVARNFKCRGGELDIVMTEGERIVFIEVRYRKSSRYGGAAASVGYHKQRRIQLAAQLFLLQQPSLANRPCRFDVFAIEGNPEKPVVNWIKDAFQASE